MRRSLLLIPVASLVLASGTGCKKDAEAPRIDLGHDYFPIDTGRWIDYHVDSVWQNDLTGVSGSRSYVVREKITEDFTDPEGRAAQRLVRYYQDSTTQAWTPHDVWWEVRSTTQAERAEENQRRIKLIFPPRIGQYWNTNATNTDAPYELTYEEVDVPWSANGLSFDSTLLVKTTYPDNNVITNTYYERYAKHVGLVYREVDSTNMQTTGVRGTWLKQVVTGYGQ
jgi:hypothetical protein